MSLFTWKNPDAFKLESELVLFNNATTPSSTDLNKSKKRKENNEIKLSKTKSKIKTRIFEQVERNQVQENGLKFKKKILWLTKNIWEN